MNIKFKEAYIMEENGIKELENFFFEAMLNGGWLTGESIVTIDELPNYEMYSCKEGILRLVDIWTAKNCWSSGSTNILVFDHPTWVMNYSGWYDEQAIPLLKKALKETYKERLFAGGRGTNVKDGDLIYHNVWTGSFTNFSGKETVYTEALRPLGYHQYNGRFIDSPKRIRI